MNEYDYKNLTPFKWFILENFPFIEETFDALTNYQLFCKLGKEMNKIIDNVNLSGEQVENLTNAFIQLQNYVNNYFDNLDVQEEIDNKLDEMALQGTLQEIITTYLQVSGILAFNNVSDMKNSEDLINGSYVQTFGFYNINDGGKAKYKIRNITNEDIVDNKFILSLNNENLIAELIIDGNTNIKTIGALGNNINDDTEYFIAFINKLNYLKVDEGVYLITNTINISNINVNIKGKIIYNGTDYAFTINNSNYKNYSFGTIISENGGILKLFPSDNEKSIIYNNFSIINGNAKNENLLLNATNGYISLNNFNCKRLRSTENSCIKMIINNGENTYINENNFIGIDIKSVNNKAIYSEATGNNVEIQYNLTNCDLESSTGIHSKGKITFITLMNCRLFEISYQNKWLTIEDSLPLITIIGSGIIYPKKIELININSNKIFLNTNLDILVNENGYYYKGGSIAKNGIYNKGYTYNMNLTITNDDLNDEHYYELPIGIDNDTYNLITLNVTKWVEITIPNNPNYKEFLFHCISNNFNVTFKALNGDTILEPMTSGYYKIYYINNRIFYKKLDI